MGIVDELPCRNIHDATQSIDLRRAAWHRRATEPSRDSRRELGSSFFTTTGTAFPVDRHLARNKGGGHVRRFPNLCCLSVLTSMRQSK
ncbi:hypothetical protein F9948_03060 [Burkholderia thailandensis]|nr:hypothetical protein A8H32_12050 [Burkholderia thailandensis]MDD1479363.1 hypothetical protein [Burkholderia thailandensis]MDD1485601.1 hypothetical protein [Burkholderia thailandensis]MDD1491234.1 hypothetical protein [Burkholderia thailandensis]TGB35015.1 hypothetical protein C6946_03950 [Burkholderia thailandensis]